MTTRTGFPIAKGHEQRRGEGSRGRARHGKFCSKETHEAEQERRDGKSETVKPFITRLKINRAAHLTPPHPSRGHCYHACSKRWAVGRDSSHVTSVSSPAPKRLR